MCLGGLLTCTRACVSEIQMRRDGNPTLVLMSLRQMSPEPSCRELGIRLTERMRGPILPGVLQVTAILLGLLACAECSVFASAETVLRRRSQPSALHQQVLDPPPPQQHKIASGVKFFAAACAAISSPTVP